jgi:peroxiredoxin
MTIKIGDRVPEANLSESTEFGDACPVAPKPVSAATALQGKRVVIFGVPGAFTPTCSAKHVPGYLASLSELKAKKVDEVWCLAANDGFVMAAWGRELGAIGKLRMLGDGGADFARKLGVDVEVPGMGVRMRRFSMFVDDGVVKSINVEAPGKFEVSDAASMLKQLS